MSYIFMDESGDLGFDWTKNRTTKYFLISFLITQEKDKLENIVKKIFRNSPKNLLKSNNGVLHCHNEYPKIRKILLDKISKLENTKIWVIYIDKTKIYTNQSQNTQLFYNYTVWILLNKILSNHKWNINFIASKRETNKTLNTNFHKYIKEISWNNIKIEIKTPAQEKWLQIVDFVSWSIFRKYEYGDIEYYKQIQNLIIEEKSMF